jgi:hypothetical protein
MKANGKTNGLRRPDRPVIAVLRAQFLQLAPGEPDFAAAFNAYSAALHGAADEHPENDQ